MKKDLKTKLEPYSKMQHFREAWIASYKEMHSLSVINYEKTFWDHQDAIKWLEEAKTNAGDMFNIMDDHITKVLMLLLGDECYSLGTPIHVE